MKSTLRILALLLALVMVLSLYPAAVFAEVGIENDEAKNVSLPDEPMASASGNVNDLSWNLASNGTLTISGSGDMPDYYDGYDDGDWRAYKNDIVRVQIGEGVSSVGDWCFGECERLVSIQLPSTLTSIGERAFLGCHVLTSITLPAGLTMIGGWAFEDSGLTAITLPDSVVSMGNTVFLNCTHLVRATLSQGLTVIPECMFEGCSALSSVRMPTELVTIQNGAFYGTGSLTSITLPDGLISIGESAFEESGLTRISLPESTIVCGPCVFRHCTALSSATLSSNMDTVSNGLFTGCSLLSRVDLPEGVHVIGEGAFGECEMLQTLTLPASLESLGVSAFEFSGLTDITIPETVRSIGGDCFWMCGSLTKIEFLGSAPSIGDRAFYDVTATAYYPKNDPSWTSSVRQNYGGEITWVAVDSTPEPNTYTVHYDANGGTGAPADQTKTEGVALTLNSTVPTHASVSAGSYTVTLDPNGGSVSPTSLSAARTTSYSFSAWNTEQNGTGASYNPGGTYRTDADVTLYAQWNSSTSTSSVDLPTPTREGYTFMGWAEAEDAESGETGSYTPEGDVTLYAIWAVCESYGDVDGDGVIDSWDASLILRYEAGLITADALNLAAADVDGDGVVDSWDASLILRYEAGLITQFPRG